MKNEILERFLRYAKIDTGADPKASVFPSTPTQTQFNLALMEELKQIGLHDVEMDEFSYLTATIPASEGYENEPTIGFMAHVDTSPDSPTADVKPLIHENYSGGDIVLPHGVISPNDYPEMEEFKGHTVITSSGDTLLGADDKAGVAAIVTASRYLLEHPEVKHGKIRIAFTCDEEIGRGVNHFDVEKFGAEFAYTLDSGGVGLVEYENFNAASVVVEITGANIHPGYAKDKMVNALELAHEIHSMLPSLERPVFTSGYEGFYHLISLSGDVNSAKMSYIVRDHDATIFAHRLHTFEAIKSEINKKYPNSTTITTTEQYRNMREVLEQNMGIVERALKAVERVGLKPKIKAIRGGTDGARLSFMGLPCPNIFTGGMNFHSKHEYLSLEIMELSAKAMIEIARANPEK